jgi:hypothetical protein
MSQMPNSPTSHITSLVRRLRRPMRLPNAFVSQTHHTLSSRSQSASTPLNLLLSKFRIKEIVFEDIPHKLMATIKPKTSYHSRDVSLHRCATQTEKEGYLLIRETTADELQGQLLHSRQFSMHRAVTKCTQPHTTLLKAGCNPHPTTCWTLIELILRHSHVSNTSSQSSPRVIGPERVAGYSSASADRSTMSSQARDFASTPQQRYLAPASQDKQLVFCSRLQFTSHQSSGKRGKASDT